MPRASQHPSETRFNLRIDPAFTAATEAEDQPAVQVVLDFTRADVKQRERMAFEAEARRQWRVISEAASDRNGEEAEIPSWIEAASDTEGWSG